MDENIIKLRKKIDEADKKLVLLLQERFELVRQIVDKKKENGIEMEDLGREKEILEKLRQDASLDSEFIEEIYKTIFKYGKKMYSK